MFHDAICLRYNFALKLVARTCVCGEDYTINHCLTCKKGGYVILKHNSLRDFIAKILEEVCSDVEAEPPLLPLTGEKLPKGSITSPGARLDMSARDLWFPLVKATLVTLVTLVSSRQGLSSALQKVPGCWLLSIPKYYYYWLRHNLELEGCLGVT